MIMKPCATKASWGKSWCLAAQAELGSKVASPTHPLAQPTLDLLVQTLHTVEEEIR